jgi:hypothetical protein
MLPLTQNGRQNISFVTTNMGWVFGVVPGRHNSAYKCRTYHHDVEYKSNNFRELLSFMADLSGTRRVHTYGHLVIIQRHYNNP